MNQLSIAVCDDCREHRDVLVGIVSRYADRRGIRVHLETYDSGAKLLRDFQPFRWQILFLDILMEPLDGVQTARLIRQKDKVVRIVFATASQDYGLEGFELGASGYLVKPVQEAEAASVLDWILEEEQYAVIRVRLGREEMLLPARDILYVEKRGHWAEIHLGGQVDEQVLSVRMTMQELEDALGGRTFCRCHRSYIVNFRRVDILDGAEFRMDNGTAVPISPSCRQEARRMFLCWNLGYDSL